jgi:hypothetical protein
MAMATNSGPTNASDAGGNIGGSSSTSPIGEGTGAVLEESWPQTATQNAPVQNALHIHALVEIDVLGLP